MEKFKKHKYIQPEKDKNCILYSIANIFNVSLDKLLTKYNSEGIGTKDMEFIINNIGYPNSYIAVLSNVISSNVANPYKIPKDSLRFIFESINNYTKEDNYLAMPCVIRLKNKRLHSIFILINKHRFIVSDPRKTHMIELSLEELLSILNCEQIAIILTMTGFRQHYGTYIKL